MIEPIPDVLHTFPLNFMMTMLLSCSVDKDKERERPIRLSYNHIPYPFS